MFDFGASHRHEGDRPGINDKGLVTFDRRTRKDAFYFYKANWRPDEPMLHLAEKRCVLRTRPQQTFMAFTTCSQAELFVNGKSYGKVAADAYATVRWEGVTLQPGLNEIRIEASAGKRQILTDSMTCTYQPR